jgi:uncharacterized protein YuzE
MQDLHITYDEEGDILYIAFRTDRRASTLSLHDNILLRYDPQTIDVVGLTIIGFSDLLTLERQGQSLALRNLTELPPQLAQVITKLLNQPPLSFYLQLGEDQRHLTTRLSREFSLPELLLAA